MSFPGELKRRLEMLLHRGRFQRELEDEMRLHLELRREQQMEAGADAEGARQAALRRFGNTTRLREESQRAWGWEWLETLAQDAGYGMRAMLRTPAVTAIALLSLALGIGANTAIFSFLDAVMLRVLPVKAPQQLVKLGTEDWDGITDSFACTELYSYPFYRAFRSKNAAFSDTAAYYSISNDVHGFVDGRADSELIRVLTVSGTYFQTLGVGAEIGRVIDEADDASEGDHPVVVISDSFWKRDLGADLAKKYGGVEVAGTTSSSGVVEIKPDPNPFTRDGTRRHEAVHKQSRDALAAKYGVDTPAFNEHWFNPQRWAADEAKAYSVGISYLQEVIWKKEVPE